MASRHNGAPPYRLSRKRLGVWVTAPDRMPDLLEIARCAGLKGIDLQIHLTGSGVPLCRRPDFSSLIAQSRVYVCHESARELGVEEMLRGFDPPLLLPCREIAALLLACDRRLVF
jgi:hypothetical protein